jgi:hypothetical protein
MGVFNNACAVRIFCALNNSGGIHAIPFVEEVGPDGKSEPQVSSGQDKSWYIFRVRVLVKYLAGRYGKPEKYKSGDYREKLKGRKGIIVFEVPVWDDATGHADLWDRNRCLWKGHGGLASQVLFWEAG